MTKTEKKKSQAQRQVRKPKKPTTNHVRKAHRSEDKLEEASKPDVAVVPSNNAEPNADFLARGIAKNRAALRKELRELLGDDREAAGSALAVALPRKPGRPHGKSSDPNYETVSFISHKELRRQAERRWEDAGQRGLSNLIEALFRLYTVGALDELIRQRAEAGEKLH